MLVQDILTEKSIISHDVVLSLQKTFSKWINWVNATYDTNVYDINDNYKNISKKLHSMLLPTIQKVVRANIPSHDDLKQYFATYKYEDLSKFQFGGHVVSLYISPYENEHYGATLQNWLIKFGSGKHRNRFRLHNEVELSITPQNIVLALYGKQSVIDSWITTLTHELLHITQSLKSKLQSTYASGTHRNLKDEISNKEKYYASPAEIDAHTQSIAAYIFMDAKQSSDPVRYINTIIQMWLKYGMRTIFGKPEFRGEVFDVYRSMFTQQSSNPKVNIFRKKVLQRFTKKLIEKLTEYKTQLQGKNKTWQSDVRGIRREYTTSPNKIPARDIE